MRFIMMQSILIAVSILGWQPSDSTGIVILPTLHQLHGQVANYDFDDLRETLERLQPDVLVVELTPSDLSSRTEQTTKVEYQQVIFPYVDRNEVPMVAMEPSQPLFDQIVKPYAENARRVAEEHPEAVEAFQQYLELFYARISDDHITSVRDLISPKFEELARLKHEYQEAVFGEGERAGWSAWNRHFLETIVRVYSDDPSRRVVVVVGYEHHYWLKEALLGNGYPLEELN
jgi:hypothetical protein